MRVKNDHRSKFSNLSNSSFQLLKIIGKFTAMIILHSHLQPQFKNELFHILHFIFFVACELDPKKPDALANYLFC